MKLRNLLGVVLAAVIAGGILYFVLFRGGGGEGGYVTAWYVEGSTAAEGFKAAVEDYNAGLSRSAMPVKLTGFKDENALASAFETETPDILLCTHYRAFDMHARGKLTDISAALNSRVPDYPKGTASRSAAIGKSFFPIGADVQALLVNEALCDASGFETLEALCAAARQYTEEMGEPFFTADSFAALFFTTLLREGEEFTAQAAPGARSESYIKLYNLLTEAAYDGAMTAEDEPGAAAQVYNGALPCAVVSVSQLAAKKSGFGVYPVPPLSAESGSGMLGEAVGLAVTAGGSRSNGGIAAFISWLFSGGRDIKLALQCSLVPAQSGTINTRDAHWSALMKLGAGEIIAMPVQESEFIENRAAFEAEFRRSMEFLAG